MVLTGLDRLVGGEVSGWEQCRAGLVVHPASVTRDLEPSERAVQRVGAAQLVALFGPQHGARGEKQDDMIESESFVDRRTGLRVHSLYGAVRKPTPDMLAGLDVLFFDLQDVGVRVYTFAWTMALAMEACRDAGVAFVVLDRPNPIGGVVAGPVLQPGFESFVGLYPVPLRHGSTLGELAGWLNATCGIGCQLDVVPCTGWDAAMWWDATGLPYVLPSPNLPTLDACTVYPGMVLLEGTNLSEGRGTTRPFELFGAPYLDADDLVAELRSYDLPGVHFRPCHFEPTFQKHAGQLCGGAQLHVLDRAAFRPIDTAVSILYAARRLAPGDFAWRPPPYEYETEKPPIDILWGSDGLRRQLEGRALPEDVMASMARPDAFQREMQPYWLYAR